MISTHILDTHLGQPAAGVTVRLYTADGQLLAETQTNTDGRIADFNHAEFQAGAYRLEFLTEAWFQSMQLKTFFPKVSIDFFITDSQQHYHVPLLISPFAYSTYRGS
ncbi:hydroxyisourate hydrolase [Acinetobacter sp. WZC-1]|uniref:hydroxyisourate hydrolase n=1 Tax=Acinetobacter sp. WZC-1 TaxID=3459034 RepID=UPI00403D9D4C